MMVSEARVWLSIFVSARWPDKEKLTLSQQDDAFSFMLIIWHAGLLPLWRGVMFADGVFMQLLFIFRKKIQNE